MRGFTLSARSIAASVQPSICLRCAYGIQRGSSKAAVRTITSSTRRNQITAPAIGRTYFFANDRNSKSQELGSDTNRKDKISEVTERIQPSDTRHNVERSNPLTVPEAVSQPRLRRRDRLKREGQAGSDGALAPLPLDASSALSSLANSAPPMSLKRRALAFLSLTKPRLATLIVLTTTASYSLYPVPSLLSVSATQTPSLSTLTLTFLTTGTFATVASANALNMLFEPAHDAKMSRTRNRPIVRGLVSKRAALVFAILTAVAGTGILWIGVNPTTAVLGASNIVLYAFVYTPMKRLSILNTWAGAVVGAIPPLMGWTAAGGHYLTTPTTPGSTTTFQALKDEASALLFTPDATGGWLLAALLFAWQFPHFNALSYPIRHEYANAGYKMAVSFYPKLNARVALRYSMAMFPICAGLTYYGITDKGFLVTSTAANAWMLKEAWRFWRTGGGETPQAAKAARGLFWASVWHLPLVLVFAMAQKRGLWSGVWRSLVGEEEDEWDDEEDTDHMTG
ncbi:UbiA prenyltransferase family-domain-containing protein [Elsinoe ampelina]|uniref:Protoheme IX farnesyltransferase, mitochondrial n=1 Tax=Elsinoe ampelina TaxID=302913 RepID=A0A6A6GFS3_9PEZI|nr:UbiA prenyltransferase family-domain-containing protein [Elsinoe ampelina]